MGYLVRLPCQSCNDTTAALLRPSLLEAGCPASNMLAFTQVSGQKACATCRVVLQRRREERKRKRAEEEATKEGEEEKDSKEAAKEEGEAKKAKIEGAVTQEVSLLSVHA